MNFKKIALVLLMSPFFVANADTEDLDNISLEDLLNIEIETAGKKSQKAEDVAASVFVITSKDIKEGGFNTLNQALTLVPGIHVTNDWNLDPIIVRGVPFVNDKVLFLVDGQTMNPRGDNIVVFNQAAPVDMHEVERIEVILGPGSALYGSGAFTGIVNVFTKQVESGARVNAYVSSASEKELSVTGGMKNENFAISVNASYFDSGGDELKFEFPNGMPPDYVDLEGVADGYNDIEDKKIAVKLNYNDFSFRLQYSNSTLGWPTAAYWTDFNNHDNYSRFESTVFQAKYPHKVSDTIGGTLRVHYNDSDQIWHGAYEGEVFETPAGDPDWHYGGKYYGFEYQLAFNPSDDLSVITGLEYTDNPDLYSIDTKISYTNISLYSMMDYKISEKLLANLGARLEKFSFRESNEFIPKAALLYKPNQAAVLKFMYGKAFLAPSAWELQVADLVGNDNLKPELFESYEFVYNHVFSSWSSSLSIFSSEIIDKRETYDSGEASSSFAFNSPFSKYSSGVDWNGTILLSSATSLKIGVSLVDTEETIELYDDVTGDVTGTQKQSMFGTSDSLGYLALRTPAGQGVLTGHVKYVSSPDSHSYIDEWTKVDLTLAYPDIKGYDVTFKVSNLFDSDIAHFTPQNTYEIVNQIPDYGRVFTVSFGKRF